MKMKINEKWSSTNSPDSVDSIEFNSEKLKYKYFDRF